MAVPKKRTSISKKRIRKKSWKRKAYWAAVKALSLGKSLSTGNSTFSPFSKPLSTAKGFGAQQRKNPIDERFSLLNFLNLKK